MEKATAVQAQLRALFQAAQSADVIRGAELILYRGSQVDQHYQRPLDPSHPEEQAHLSGMLGRIRDWLAQDPTPVFGETIVNPQSQGEWVAQEVIFRADSPDPLRRYFGFLFVQNAYRLGDIDQ